MTLRRKLFGRGGLGLLGKEPALLVALNDARRGPMPAMRTAQRWQISCRPAEGP